MRRVLLCNCSPVSEFLLQRLPTCSGAAFCVLLVVQFTPRPKAADIIRFHDISIQRYMEFLNISGIPEELRDFAQTFVIIYALKNNSKDLQILCGHIYPFLRLTIRQSLFGIDFLQFPT